MTHWIFNDEHEQFRQSVKKFVEKEMKPYTEQWEKEGIVPRSLFKKAGEMGYLGISFPEEYGGSGLDAIMECVLIEELTRSGATGAAASLTATFSIAMSKIWLFGNEEQKRKYLPQGISGEKIFALAITEPHAGSDVANIQTKATREGDHYILNGSKTFITNGTIADYVIVAAKTREEPRHQNISLFIVDTSSEGFSTGKKLNKLGIHSSDTGELYFDNVKIPKENMLGEEHSGFYYIMQDFQYERIQLALTSVVLAEMALKEAIKYSKERIQFGRPLSKFQVLRHKMVDMAVDIEKARYITYRALHLYNQGEDATLQATMAKAYAAEMVRRVTDQALQIHGGNGYMMEFPIQRYWRDSRLQPIGGGTTQIMNEILTKMLDITVEKSKITST